MTDPNFFLDLHMTIIMSCAVTILVPAGLLPPGRNKEIQ